MTQTNSILIVASKLSELAQYGELLQFQGYEVRQVHSGEESLPLIKEIRPDLILLDIDPPKVNGVEICRQIKNDSSLAGISVFLFSTQESDSCTQAEGLENGADDFLNHALEQRELLARIATQFKLRQAERRALRSHLELHQILSSIQSLLIVIDEHDLVQRWNSVAAEFFGRTFDQAHQRGLDGLKLSWEHERVAESIRSCRATMTSVHLDDLWFQRPSGQEGYLKLSLTPLITTSWRDLGGVLILGEDITKRRLLETQLLQAQKLESIGQLAAGVAHEINTPVQFVGDNMRFLQEAFSELGTMIQDCDQFLRAGLSHGISAQAVEVFHNERATVDVEYLLREIPQAIEQSQGGLDRVAHIVQSMKSFAHPGELNMVMADINKALTDTVTVSRNEWKYVAEIHMDLEKELPQVLCYVSELNQAFLNIVTNAAQAVAEAHGEHARDKGLITISTRPDGDWIEVRISDNGPGIPQDVLPRLFDPFFTTKEVGKGTGQGLVIAHNAVVKRHGGTITVETETGQGATFIIRLPQMPAEDAKTIERLA